MKTNQQILDEWNAVEKTSTWRSLLGLIDLARAEQRREDAQIAMHRAINMSDVKSHEWCKTIAESILNPKEA